jgi:cytochrome oxidase Cu insertion factor (SCO1/SenC/PrrC family)
MLKKHKAYWVLAFFAVVLISVSVFLSGCGKTQTAENKVAPQQGYLAPDFELEDLTGEQIALSSLLSIRRDLFNLSGVLLAQG